MLLLGVGLLDIQRYLNEHFPDGHAPKLVTARQINRACRAYVAGESSRAVYCTAPAYRQPERVRGARTVKGSLIVYTVNGHQIFDAESIFTV